MGIIFGMDKYQGKNPEKAASLKSWEEKLSVTGDRLGRGIDEGIFRTVLFLNAMGITTVSSCEGHLDHGEASPWIAVEVDQDEKWHELKAERDAAFLKARTEKDTELYKKAHALDADLQRPSISLVYKLWPLLEEFYKDRNVEFDVRLMVWFLGFGCGRLNCQGCEVQVLRSEEEKLVRLKMYQEEMSRFTDFLAEKYFAS